MDVGRVEFAIPVVQMSTGRLPAPMDADTQRVLTLLSEIQRQLAELNERLTRLEDRAS